MEIKWLNSNLIEVNGARDGGEAQWFVEQETGRTVTKVLHIAASLYQVQVR